MLIKKIFAENFKTFDRLDLSLGSMNFVIGANASGKSNFISVFDFIRNISRHGLKDAISMQGGPEYLRNRSLPTSRDLSIAVEYVLNPRLNLDRRYGTPPTWIGCRSINASYRFTLTFKGNEFGILEDTLSLTYTFVKLKKMEDGGYEELEPLDTLNTSLTRKDRKSTLFL